MVETTLPSPFLSEREPECRVFRGAYATVTRARFPAPGARHGSLAGCLYTSDFERIDLSQREGGHFGDLFPSENPTRLEAADFRDAPLVRGRCLYLGHLMQHYGHFLIETLPNLGWARRLPEFDWLVFHPSWEKGMLPGNLFQALTVLGIPAHKLRVIEAPVQLEEVVVPERLFAFHHRANTRAREMYQVLRDTWAPDDGKPSLASPAIFLSRVNVSLYFGRTLIANEGFLEEQLLRLGFDVVCPENLSWEEQVRLFGAARFVVSAPGSGPHNILFGWPGGTLLEIGDARSVGGFYPTQSLCNQLAGWRALHLPFKGTMLARKPGWEVCWLPLAAIRRQIVQDPSFAALRDQLPRRGRRIGGGSFRRGLRLMLKGLLRAGKDQAARLAPQRREGNA